MKRLRNSVVKWLVVSLICLLLGFLLGKFKQDILQEQILSMSSELQKMNTDHGELQKEMARLQIEENLQQQTIKSLVQSNKLLQDELSTVNNKLFFYERVVAPELDATGVKIFSFEITQNVVTEQWEYQLVLMQSQKERRFLSGKVAISLSLFKDEVLQLVPLSEFAEQVEDNFKFKYFQTIQGTFALPEGLSVDEVVVQLNVAGNRWFKAQNVEERYDWRVLTTQDSGELSEFETLEEKQ